MPQPRGWSCLPSSSFRLDSSAFSVICLASSWRLRVLCHCLRSSSVPSSPMLGLCPSRSSRLMFSKACGSSSWCLPDVSCRSSLAIVFPFVIVLPFVPPTTLQDNTLRLQLAMSILQGVESVTYYETAATGAGKLRRIETVLSTVNLVWLRVAKELIWIRFGWPELVPVSG